MGKQRRWKPSTDQICYMEEKYRVCSRPDRTMRKEIAKCICAEEAHVKNWFQNRRQRSPSRPRNVGADLMLHEASDAIDIERSAVGGLLQEQDERGHICTLEAWQDHSFGSEGDSQTSLLRNALVACETDAVTLMNSALLSVMIQWNALCKMHPYAADGVALLQEWLSASTRLEPLPRA